MNIDFLSKICAPSIAFMNRLKYPAKIMILVTLIVLMSGGIIGFLLINLQTQANFSIKESQGIEYITPTKNLLLDLQKYRENKLESPSSKIAQDISDIDSIDEKYNKIFRVENQWEELKSSATNAAQSYNYNNIDDSITKTFALLDTVTNNSNLILDPDLDTYYLMDSYCLRYSNMIEKIYKLKAEGVKKLSGKSYSQYDMLKTSVLLGEQNDIAKSNSEVIYKNNTSAKSELDEYVQAGYNSTEAFLSLTKSIINGSKISAESYTNAANQALNANINVNEKFGKLLKDLALKRANKYLSQQPISVIGTLLALLIIGYLFAGFYLSLISSVNAISNQLFTSAKEIEDTALRLEEASHILAEGNQEQAAAAQETASSLEESSSMVLQNAENAKTAAHLSSQAKIHTEKGSNEVSDMLQSMVELQDSSSQIAKIIKVIDEIAFQTNLLSLNAAVEAARAGDAGKGFAVVAEEVRNLAQRSAEAAKSTAEIIENNIHLSQKGVEASQITSKALKEISESVQKVNEIINEVAVATNEQSLGINQIQQAMSQISTVTNKNAQIAEDNSTDVSTLSEQAQNISVVVNGLISLINGAENEDSTNEVKLLTAPDKKLLSNKSNYKH